VRTVSATTEYTVSDQERMKLAPKYFEWQARLVKAHVGRRVLEIGCGVGNFTRHLLDRELVVGIDVESACVASLLQALDHPQNLAALQMDVVDPAFLQLRQYNPDTVVCLNVLEHIEDHVRALEHMRDVLPVGGKAILIIPAFESLYGPIDANLGHFRRYSKQPFRELVESLGFQARTLRYMNSIGCLGWWVNAKILKKTEQSETQIRFFDAKVVPVMSRLEDLVEPPFGQSLFAVLEKTGPGGR